MKAECGHKSLQTSRLEILVCQIMKIFRMNRAEATAMAIGMLFEEFIIAASMSIAASEQAHVVA